MYAEHNLRECCQRILEDNGGKVADKASRILLEDPALKDLRQPLEFISKNWRDPLTPSLMGLACEAVGGRPDVTHEVALAMSLMNLSFYIWDDIIDKASSRLFKPTVVRKFGEGTALMIGGLASAKAFSLLNQMDVDKTRRQVLTKLFWNLWSKMAKAETANMRLRFQRNSSPRKKLWVIKTEAAADLGTCLTLGAILGDGSEDEVKHLGRYGLHLGIILELWKDFYVSINLSLELAEKIRSGALPYSLLWASSRSERIQKKLRNLANRDIIDPSDIKDIVKQSLELKSFNNTLNFIRRSSKKAIAELVKLKRRNKSTQTLEFFVEAQPQLFIESLKVFLIGEG